MNKDVVRYLTEKEAADLTRLSPAWFQRMRWSGKGIPFVKLGRAVRYRESDIISYFENRKLQNTLQQNERQLETN